MSPDPEPSALGGGWRVTSRVRNPWGQVPLTAGGRSLPSSAQTYMERLLEQQGAPDTISRRHHYVPQTYLRKWSFDGKRVWTLDTAAHRTRPLGVKDVCVEENFYRVVGPGGLPHNRVELLFGVVDSELRRVQSLFADLEDPDVLEFDDLIALGVTVAMQRMRTLQQRRVQRQYNLWLHAQNPQDWLPFDDPTDPHRAAGIHARAVFTGMWEAADVMTTRQIEIWHDPQGRFMTCDAPVLVPFDRKRRPGLHAAPYILWPVSPHRVVALARDSQGEKAVIHEADGKRLGAVREAVEQGRERMIFASENQRDRLPTTKLFGRRAQVRMRCTDHTPHGEYVPPPGCCVEQSETISAAPDVDLCNQGLHVAAPAMWELA